MQFQFKTYKNVFINKPDSLVMYDKANIKKMHYYWQWLCVQYLEKNGSREMRKKLTDDHNIYT